MIPLLLPFQLFLMIHVNFSKFFILKTAFRQTEKQKIYDRFIPIREEREDQDLKFLLSSKKTYLDAYPTNPNNSCQYYESSGSEDNLIENESDIVEERYQRKKYSAILTQALYPQQKKVTENIYNSNFLNFSDNKEN